MAFRKLTMQVGSVGIENTPLTITTNLEVKSWILEDLRLNTQEITLGSDVNSMAANIFYALNQDCGIGDIFGECLVEYNGTDTVSITFFDTNVTSASYTLAIQNGLSITDTEESVSSAWSKKSQDILVGSPYFIGLGDSESPLGNINGCNLDMYIYKGDFLLDRPATPTYQLNTLSTSINETIYFDLSDMIKDYLEPVYSDTSTPVCECVWVDVFPTVNYNGTDYALAPEYHRAFIGYGYFEDGPNPLLIDYSPDAAHNDYKEILNESPKIIIPTGEDFEIAVDSNLVDTVEYFDSSDVSLKLDTITGSDASSSQIIYSTSPDAVETSYVVVTNLDTSTSQINVEYQDECLYTPYRLTFINRNGVYERLWFFKNSEKKASYDKDEFRRNTMSAGSYNLVDHQQKNLFKKSKETLKINSGFYSEDFNDVFNQLMLSESVWINYNSRELPVNIKDSSFTFKTRFNEKLINHTLELEFAFDKVNSVR
jgi:hypothetical protein